MAAQMFALSRTNVPAIRKQQSRARGPQLRGDPACAHNLPPVGKPSVLCHASARGGWAAQGRDVAGVARRESAPLRRQPWPLHALAEDNFTDGLEFITFDSTSVHVEVMDASTASVRLRTPDRAGLLNDITSAIANVGLMVESATISTPTPEMVDNSFLVKVPAASADQGVTFEGDEGPSSEFEDAEDLLEESVLEKRLKEAVLLGVTTGVKAPPALSSSAQGTTPPEVTVTETGGKLVVLVKAADREGLLVLLSGTFQRLTEAEAGGVGRTAAWHQALGLEVLSANIRTLGEVINNKFVLTGPTDVDADRIRSHVLEALRTGKQPAAA